MIEIIVAADVLVSGMPESLLQELCRNCEFANPKRAKLLQMFKHYLDPNQSDIPPAAQRAYNSKARRIKFMLEHEPETIVLWRRTGANTSFPRGMLSSIVTFCETHGQPYRIQDITVCPEAPIIEERGELYTYQDTALDAMLSGPTGVLEAPTGSGKTQVLLSAAARLGTNTLIVVHTTELMAQTMARTQEWLGVEAGRIGGGKKDKLAQITVAMVQTLMRRDLSHDDLSQYFGAVIVDECFVAGTKVDGISIENIRVNDTVLSYDINCKCCSKQTVTRVFCRPVGKTLIRITVGSRQIICTPNHKILTRYGWVEAAYLSPKNDEVMDYESYGETMSGLWNPDLKQPKANSVPEMCRQSEDSNHPRSLCVLRTACISPNEASETDSQAIGPCILQRKVQAGGLQKNKLGNDVQDKPHLCRRENENQESNVCSGSEAKGNVFKKKARRLEAHDTGRERSADTKAGTNSGRGFGMDLLSSQNHEEVPIPDQLQDRSGQRVPENCNRGGRTIPQGIESPRTGYQEGEVTVWVRVDRIEILKQGSDGEFERVCPDGNVYNLEVSDTNTYTANGIVVSNCHHSPATSYSHVLRQLPARYKYGVTATAWRKDRMEFLLYRVIGPITARIEKSVVQAAGKIVWPMIEWVATNYYYPATDSSDWTKMITHLAADEDRNSLIVSKVQERIIGRRALILTDRIEHANRLAEMLAEYEPILLTGDVSKADRSIRMERIRAGAQCTVATVHLMGEGIDVPGWDLLFLVSPISGGPRTLQALGRIARPSACKSGAVLVDFVDTRVKMLKGAAAARAKLYAK